MVTHHKTAKREDDRTAREKEAATNEKESWSDVGDADLLTRTHPTTNPDSDAGAATGDPGSRPEEPWRKSMRTNTGG